MKIKDYISLLLNRCRMPFGLPLSKESIQVDANFLRYRVAILLSLTTAKQNIAK